MAASTDWRKRLNEQAIFDVLRSSKEDLKKSKYCRGLIEIVDGELYVWNSYNSSLLTTNLKCLGAKQQQDRVSHQTFLSAAPPLFEVEWLTFSETARFVALSGQRGVSVLQLPQRTGKYAEYDGGKKKINCRTIPIGERLFVSNSKMRLLHVAWHPGSPTDSHLVVLTSDNVVRIYDIGKPQDPVQSYQLSDSSKNYSVSASRSSFNVALGESAVSFDFGQKTTVESRIRPRLDKKPTSVPVWPMYILWGNGDVYMLQTTLDNRSPVKSRVTGPLSMYPAAEDNYGTDACSIKCLTSSPPLLVISTCAGKLYHSVVLPSATDECESDLTWDGNSSLTGYDCAPSPVSLYVFESIELELSLTTVTVDSDDVVGDDFSCPIRLHKDPACVDRYHCSHSAGVHTVVVPWLYRFQQYVTDEEAELPDASSQDSETIVEHLICTKPLPTSPPSPVLGLTLTSHSLLGPTLLCLTSTLECITLPLLKQPRLASANLLSTSPARKVESPLKRLQSEPFDEHIRKILKKNASNPLLRGASNTELPPQELFQLLSRSTQVFREERIQKLDLARQEIERRIRVLTEQKEMQLADLAECEQMRNILTSNAENLAEKYEDIADKQQQINDRLEAVLRKLQAQCGELTVAERTMQKDLRDMDIKLKQHKNALDQLSMKQTYQNKQIAQRKQQRDAAAGSKSNGGSPAGFNKPQSDQLKSILKQEGEQIGDLVKRVNNMKLQLQA